ncbi:DNA-binding response regulator, partial [Staphylococcus warneri]
MKDYSLKSYKEKVGLNMSYNALIVEDDIDIA